MERAWLAVNEVAKSSRMSGAEVLEAMLAALIALKAKETRVECGALLEISVAAIREQVGTATEEYALLEAAERKETE